MKMNRKDALLRGSRNARVKTNTYRAFYGAFQLPNPLNCSHCE